MKKIFLIYFIFSSFLFAREELIFTIPKTGTHYLIKILENITGNVVVLPTTPDNWKKNYNNFKSDDQYLVVGHCEPTIFEYIEDNKPILLLIRDPRDMCLSAIDYIDKRGVNVWPGLHLVIDNESWKKLNRKEKAVYLIEQSYDERGTTVKSLFETAINLTLSYPCFLVKFEDICPIENSKENAVNNVLFISNFMGKNISENEALLILEKSFKNPNSQTLNQGKCNRYVDEDRKLRKYLDRKLIKYINYFKY